MESKKFQIKETSPLAELEFSVACNSISISKDRNRVLAVGVYKPSVKLFDLKSTTLKFERHLNSDPIKVIGLEDDAEKFAILRNDKTIEFHTKNGLHEKIKTPNQPKDMAYNTCSAELYLGGNYNEIYRFNMEQGRFLKSIDSPGCNMAWSNIHGLLGTICKSNLTVIDTRSKTVVFSREYENELISIAQDETGLKYAIGNENGELFEYDFRSTVPIRTINFENFVQKIKFSNENLIVADHTNIYIVHESCNDVKTAAKIEVGFSINDFAVDGGAILIGGESDKIKIFSSEDLGDIPSWIEY